MKKTKTKQKDIRVMGQRSTIWFWYQYNAVLCGESGFLFLLLFWFYLVLILRQGLIVESKIVWNSFVEQAGLPTSSCFCLLSVAIIGMDS